jgi:hypothetical protein
MSVMSVRKLVERIEGVNDELTSLRGTSNNRSTELGRKMYNRKSALYRRRKRLATAIVKRVSVLNYFDRELLNERNQNL